GAGTPNRLAAYNQGLPYPAVCVIVYGNQTFEKMHSPEIKDILAKDGCVKVVGRAWIGEHSFSR
ncbi:MAG TPA: hypothetical protein PLS83_08565, partial [Methanothrix soehngenii]|nr:hypothetical protein [Methanothrix soehngenii]